MTTFKFYFVCSLGSMILKETYPEWTLFAKGGLELKEIEKDNRRKQSYNPDNNILTLFNNLAQVRIAASKTILDI